MTLSDIRNSRSHLTLGELVSHLQIVSIWLLIGTLPFYMYPIKRIVMLVAGVLFFAEFFINKRYKTWHWDRNKGLFVIFIIFYLLIFVWHIFGEETSPRWHKVIEQRLPFLLCGVVGLLGFSEKVRLRDIGYAFLATAILSSVYIIIRAGGWAFFLPSYNQRQLFMEARILYVANHMVYNLFLNITLIFALYLLQRESLRKAARIIVSIAALWVIVLLCLTEGRVGLFTMILLISIAILQKVTKYGWRVLPVLTVFASIGLLVVIQHDRFDIEYIKRDPRVMIMQAGIETVKEAPIIGQGVCQARQTFVEKVHEDEALYEWWKGYVDHRRHGDWTAIHPHNAFVEVWSEFGIIGLSMLLLIFLYPIIMRPTKNRLYLLLVVMCFVVQCAFDTFLAPLLYGLSVLFFTSPNAISRGKVG